MKIVVLDGYTLNPGDLSWDALNALGDCSFYDFTLPGQVVERAAGAEAVLTNKVSLTRSHLESLPDLRYIGVLATGFNMVDIQTARERNIPVSNVPAYGTASVSQMTFALLLELTQHIGHHARTVQDGLWAESLYFCYWDYPLIELAGLTMGIIGLGNIGQAVSRLARAFEMPVIAYTPRPKAGIAADINLVGLETVFQESDVVSLHCPLTPDTEKLVNADRLSLMKPSAFLINTSRGGLVNEPDLADALNSGGIAGAGLDVVSVEPPVPDNPLFTARNCIVTPHIAWATRAARARLMATVVENLKAYMAGKPQNVVNL
ncbi:MAG: D-2-hydroxyacid dehydrogenase [Armatimonadetes bacterium]|nr:D-2-hydroxyacid dehydrogenase [Armatimonadota bacterium]